MGEEEEKMWVCVCGANRDSSLQKSAAEGREGLGVPGGEWGPWESFIHTRGAEPLAGSCRICEVGGII